jgi:PAS domain S-box-containing protein/putative nucleotidyltransferase with HDIG domain
MSKKLRVLIAEDSEDDAELLCIELHNGGFEPLSERVETHKAMADALKNKAWDVIITDYSMPHLNGFQALKLLRSIDLDIPCIVVSGKIGEDIAVQLMKAGANDYVMKGNLKRLAPAIERELGDAQVRRERKQAEDSLRRKQLMLARTESIAHVGSWEWDIATDTVIWSDELFRIFQREPQERAPSFAEHPALYHPDDFALLRQAVEAAVADGTPYELELRAIRKDGETRICVARGVAERATDGRVVCLFGSLQDITERKQAEQALQQSEAKYRLLAEHTTDVIRMLDMNLKTTYLSPSAEKLRGFTLQEMVEMPLERQLAPESFRTAYAVLSEEVPRVESDPGYNPIHTLDIEYYCKDGTTLWTETKFSLIRDENGRAVSILAEARDISERKQAEEKLVKSYESLKKALNDSINTMVKIVELRDLYTAGHQQKVADLAIAIAGEIKLEHTRLENLKTAAIIHDIGKIYVPSEILSKQGKLTDIEFSLIKTHSQAGFDIVRGMDLPCNISRTVLQHHERLDGSGYPNNLKGEDILLEAKILAVADVVEAMATHRPYRPALGIDKALEEISKNKGTLYDPEIVNACLKVFNEKKFSFEK